MKRSRTLITFIFSNSGFYTKCMLPWKKGEEISSIALIQRQVLLLQLACLKLIVSLVVYFSRITVVKIRAGVFSWWIL